jgi:hypothetical protein
VTALVQNTITKFNRNLSSSLTETCLRKDSVPMNITFLNIHRLVFVFKCPVSLSKYNVSETGFCLRLQVKPTQLGPIDRASPYLRIPVSLSRGYINQAQHRPSYIPLWKWHTCPEIETSSIDWTQLSRFYLKTETESSFRNIVFW